MALRCSQDPVAQFAFSPNRWPSSPAFQAAMQTYFHEANACANELLRVFAMALDLAPDFFESKVWRTHTRPVRAQPRPALPHPPPAWPGGMQPRSSTT